MDAETSSPGRVALVGNAPEIGEEAACIDAADWVVRFNNAPLFGGRAGRRVTHLALVNHGGQMRAWLAEDGFLDRPVVRGARAFLFPFPRKAEPALAGDADGRDWTAEAKARLAPLGRPVSVLPDTVHREARAILGPGPAPSTGLLVALHLLARLPRGTAVDVHGFGFEGWSGHDWRAERRWFEAMRDSGRLALHPVGAARR